MLKTQYDCDVCGVASFAGANTEGEAAAPEGIPLGWIEVFVRRRVVNPEWEEQATAQSAIVEAQMGMAKMQAQAAGHTLTDAELEEAQELVEMQTYLQAPVNAPEFVDVDVRVHFCPTHAKNVIPLLGEAVWEAFGGDEATEGGAS